MPKTSHNLLSTRNLTALLGTVLILCMLLAVVYLGRLFASPEYLVTHLPDDAFYYFQIAKNIARGQGSSFDGVTLTNGYHPLWMMIIVPLFKVFSSPLAAVHASLVLNGLCFLASVGVFALFLKRLGMPRVGILMLCLIWITSPFTLLMATNGLETSLATLCLLTLLFKVYTFTSLNHLTLWQKISLGLIAGLCILTRIDYTIYVLYVFAWYGCCALAPRRERLKTLALSCGITLLLIAPWFIWNKIAFGSFIQTSGTAFTDGQRSLVAYANQHIHPLLRFAKASFSKTIEGLNLLLRLSGIGAAFLLILGFVYGHGVGQSTSARDGSSPVVKSFLWLALPPMVLYFFANTSYRWAVRLWYFPHFIPLALLCLAPYFILIWKHYEAKEMVFQRLFVGTILACSILSGYGWYWFKEMRPPLPEQAAMLAASRWLDHSLAPHQSIGVYNSGIIGFFTNNHTVINIDGIVNNEAAEYLRRHTLAEYLHKKGITYVVDFENAVFFKYAIIGWWGDPGKDLVYKETLPKPAGVQNPIKVYQVQ